MHGGRATLRNCILCGNTAIKGGDQIFNDASKTSPTTYSNVQGGYIGTGNIDNDPLFVNASGGDYKLQSTTPCNNVGGGTMPDDLGDLDWDSITSEPVPFDLAGVASGVNHNYLTTRALVGSAFFPACGRPRELKFADRYT